MNANSVATFAISQKVEWRPKESKLPYDHSVWDYEKPSTIGMTEAFFDLALEVLSYTMTNKLNDIEFVISEYQNNRSKVNEYTAMVILTNSEGSVSKLYKVFKTLIWDYTFVQVSPNDWLKLQADFMRALCYHFDYFVQKIKSTIKLWKVNFESIKKYKPFQFCETHYEIYGGNLNNDCRDCQKMREEAIRKNSTIYNGIDRNGGVVFHGQYTYLMYSEGSNICKIGRAKDWKARLAQINTSSPTKYMCYGIIKANIEKDLHKIFAEKRMNGEWFSVHPEEVIEYIKTKMSIGSDYITIFNN